MLKEAKRVSKRINFKKGKAERIDFPESFFAFVFSIDVIHHIESIIDYFKEAYKVLKNEGKICTVTDSECIIKSRVPLSTYFPESVPYELTMYPRISIPLYSPLCPSMGWKSIAFYNFDILYF